MLEKQYGPSASRPNINKMAYEREDMLAGDDLDAILDAIDDESWENDEDFRSELSSIVEAVEKQPSVIKFQCEMCTKQYKTKQGLSRHKSQRHDKEEGKHPTAEERLPCELFQTMINKCAMQLAISNCYSEQTIAAFSTYNCSLEDAMFTYEAVRKVIVEYDGVEEKFYPVFYDCVSDDEIVFKNLNRKCAVILGFDLAHYVLAHLNGTKNYNDNDGRSVETPIEAPELKDKQRNIVKYICGYVFKTLYGRLRKSKSHQSDTNMQHISILLAGKDTSEATSTEDDRFIHAKNRGGLWKVTDNVFELFLSVDNYFRGNVGRDKNQIDVNFMVSSLMTNSNVISHFTILKYSASEVVDDEISLNLLVGMLTLYLRARTFKYVSLKMESFKLESSKKKMKSLRTSIKQGTKKLEHGH